MTNQRTKNIIPLELDSIHEDVIAEPKVDCCSDELEKVLNKLYDSIEHYTIIEQRLDDFYELCTRFNLNESDRHFVLSNLNLEHFVAKIIDLSRGAKARKSKTGIEEYMYVFKYPCSIALKSNCEIRENILLYIKIKIILESKVILISFHANRPKLI